MKILSVSTWASDPIGSIVPTINTRILSIYCCRMVEIRSPINSMRRVHIGAERNDSGARQDASLDIAACSLKAVPGRTRAQVSSWLSIPMYWSVSLTSFGSDGAGSPGGADGREIWSEKDFPSTTQQRNHRRRIASQGVLSTGNAADRTHRGGQ
jgi:hypothetical protein